jgi:hypothetical protein
VQKVVGSSPIIRFQERPAHVGLFDFRRDELGSLALPGVVRF